MRKITFRILWILRVSDPEILTESPSDFLVAFRSGKSASKMRPKVLPLIKGMNMKANRAKPFGHEIDPELRLLKDSAMLSVHCIPNPKINT